MYLSYTLYSSSKWQNNDCNRLCSGLGEAENPKSFNIMMETGIRALVFSFLV